VIEVRETPEFTRWLVALNDQCAVLHIVRRISRMAAGNTGEIAEKLKDWNESRQT
jgi:putative component of toxin-antitoxin plasmid stabilization module